MNNRMKYIMAALVATGLTMSSARAVITVNWGANGSSFVTDGSANYLDGDLVEIGTFASGPTIGSPSLAGFTVFGTTLTSEGAFSAATTASDIGFAHNQIYLVTFNASTTGAATQEGIFFVNDANNAAWKFPATADFPNSCTFDLDSFFATPGISATLAPGATIVYGQAGFDPAGFDLLMMPTPEPSTYILVGTGLLGLLAFRRHK